MLILLVVRKGKSGSKETKYDSNEAVKDDVNIRKVILLVVINLNITMMKLKIKLALLLKLKELLV